MVGSQNDGVLDAASENLKESEQVVTSIECSDGNIKTEEPSEEEKSSIAEEEEVVYISHFKNAQVHPAYVRYGIPIFLFGTIALLINADLGDAVRAEYLLLQNGELRTQQDLLVASIFSSVKELWNNGSYPLAILIAVTSIIWPYVKLFISLYVWFSPYQKFKRRERLIEILDAVGKWSFVDVVVLVQIIVAFRSTINLVGTVTLEVVILAEWGFYAFIIATMMSLIITHFILHFHRKVHYHVLLPNSSNVEEEKDSFQVRGGLTNKFFLATFGAVVLSFGLYIAGCVVDIFQVDGTSGEVTETNEYSVFSIGKTIMTSQLDSNDVGTRFLQIMWYVLCVVMPLLCTFLFGMLYLVPLSNAWTARLFVVGEIAFAWSCAEVMAVSTIFSVLQMPTFGEGLIEADCQACYVIDTEIFGSFALLYVGSILIVVTNVYLYRKGHHIIYET